MVYNYKNTLFLTGIERNAWMVKKGVKLVNVSLFKIGLNTNLVMNHKYLTIHCVSNRV